ncbi:MAG: hypothetical protein WD875_00100 [Pirellulales bacterium]
MVDSTDDSLTTPTALQSAAHGAAAAVEVCPNCEAERTDTSVPWCRKCGYHPTLDRTIDLVGDDLDREQTAEPEEATAKPSATEGLAILVRTMPVWMRRTAMAAVAAAALGVAARLATDPEGIARLVCTLLLLFIASVSIVTAHAWSYFYAVPESDRLGIGDFLLRPFYVWSPTMRDIELPGVWRRPALMAFGIVAEVVGLAVVGGIPWDRVWELGPAEPPKRRLVEAVANIGQEDDPSDADGSAGSAKAAQPRADCVIIGYIPGVASRIFGDSADEPDFSSLVLASDVRGKLRYVGTVSGGIPEEDRIAIRKRLKELRRSSPIIPCGAAGIWLEPALACRVAYARISEDNRLEELAYDKLLAELP